MQIDTWIKRAEVLIALRRWFHMHPEPSMKEYETAAKIEEELTRIALHTAESEKPGFLPA